MSNVVSFFSLSCLSGRRFEMSMSKKQSGSTEKAFLMGPVDFQRSWEAKVVRQV